MASITSLGAGTSLDSEAIVTQLIAAERKPADARLDDLEETTTAKITAYGAVKAALAGVRDTLQKLLADGSGLGRNATVATGAGFTVTASQGAAIGKYSVTVDAVATAHTLQTAGTAAGTSLGYGKLTIQTGSGTPLEVNIAQDKQTLADIRDAINVAAGGKGVTASVVKGATGDVLMLTSTDEGTDGALTITASGGDGQLARFNTAGGDRWAVNKAPTDALVTINGVQNTFQTNTVNMVDGLTLNLTKADPGASYDVTVGADSSTLKANLLSFISAYNTAVNKMAEVSKSAKDASGPLSGDSVMRNLMTSMRGAISANYKALSDLGMKTAVDGTLSLDGAKFDAAVLAAPDSMKALMGTDGTLGSSLRTTISNTIGVDGSLTSKTDSLLDKAKDIDKQRDALDRKMEALEARMRKQFGALSSILAGLETNSSFIQQQIDAMSASKK